MDIRFVKQIPFFSHLSDEKLRLVVDHFDMKSFNAGDMVVQQGEPGDGMYGIIFGEADVIMDDKTVATLKTDDFFGEMSLIANEPRSATVQAKSDLSVFFLTKLAFDAIKDELGDEVRQEILRRAEEDYGQ